MRSGETKNEKVKAKNADVIVVKTKKGPYYQIKYYDLEAKEEYMGYGSYDLDTVFNCLETHFELVQNVVGEKQDMTISKLISEGAISFVTAIMMFNFPYAEIRVNKDKISIVHRETGRILHEMLVNIC